MKARAKSLNFELHDLCDLNGFIPKKSALMAQYFHRDGDRRLPLHPMLRRHQLSRQQKGSPERALPA
jgi:hypothetical protein